VKLESHLLKNKANLIRKENKHMKRGKFERTGSKALAMILAVILVLGSVIGGTMAWLIDTTDEVKNTFTYGDINLDLDETDTELDDDDDDNTNEYEMIPGNDIVKDPKITVKAESMACWLFVKLEKSANFDDFMEYEIADGWTQLKDAQGNYVPGVYFREVGEVGEQDVVYHVIKNDEVKVKETVTKEMLNALNPEGKVATYPTLTVTGYAVQRVGFEPEISVGATAPTTDQINAAAALAWAKTGA
jgi:predicted ribosomally synthesized peptide with SipW-like signal peptide